MQRRQFLQSLLTASISTAAGIAGQPRPNERAPNIVLIYADDVGFGDLSCYGATAVRTPNLDRLAGGGLRFSNAHSPSATCTPSRYALLTGEYAWRKPGTAILPGDAALIIRPDQVTIPSLLQTRGYRTGVVGKWHLGLGNGNVDWNGEIRPGPKEVGFDYSFLIPATGDRVPCVFVENGRVVNLDPMDPIRVSYTDPFPGETIAREHPESLRMKFSHGHDMAVVNGVGRIGYMTGGNSALWKDEDIADTLTSKAIRFMEDRQSDPFFLYFATHDIHVPRLPNARFRGKTTMGPRGDAIAELDWSVGQVLATLDRLHLTDTTLVLFSSDNGPVVDDGYQDGAVEHLGVHKPAGPLRGGKYSNFDGGTRVPLLARWPGRIKPDSVSKALVGQVDFLSTFASLANAKLPAAAGPDSMDVSAALLGQSPEGRRSLVEHAGALALLQGPWKLIEPSDGPSMNRDTHTELGNSGELQLYNLDEDPGERKNVAALYPDRAKTMAAELERVRAAGRSRE